MLDSTPAVDLSVPALIDHIYRNAPRRGRREEGGHERFIEGTTSVGGPDQNLMWAKRKFRLRSQEKNPCKSDDGPGRQGTLYLR